VIGARLRAARSASSLSLRALAERVGVSHQAIYKYEMNQDIPSSDVLIRLSNELGVKPEYFFREPCPVRIVPAFRKHKRLSRRAENAVMNRVAEALERRLELERLASVRVQDGLPKDLLDRRQGGFVDGAEEVAKSLRSTWGLGTAPIDNLVEVLEDRGVRVEVVSGVDSGFDACGFWAKVDPQAGEHAFCEDTNPVRIPVIAVRLEVPGDRQRFSLAHELGHLVLDPSLDAEAKTEIHEEPIEKAANRFAGAFLVHSDAAFQELGTRRRDLSLEELLLLKRKYKFSIQAWIHRAEDLGIISRETKTRLFRRIGAKGWRVTEPCCIPSEIPTKARQIALRAISEGMISRAKAAELLNMSLSELLEEGG
jgi:Zn-dependent peptidase ImmA (M78 family)/transcriptional regulator with XRE-family HTH domain